MCDSSDSATGPVGKTICLSMSVMCLDTDCVQRTRRTIVLFHELLLSYFRLQSGLELGTRGVSC